MTNWKEYNGSDEQIAEINKCNVVLRMKSGNEKTKDEIFSSDLTHYLPLVSHYLICIPHPLSDMIIRQAHTGQPVWIRYPIYSHVGVRLKKIALVTTTPDWNIPNAEYSFKEFE